MYAPNELVQCTNDCNMAKPMDSITQITQYGARAALMTLPIICMGQTTLNRGKCAEGIEVRASKRARRLSPIVYGLQHITLLKRFKDARSTCLFGRFRHSLYISLYILLVLKLRLEVIQLVQTGKVVFYEFKSSTYISTEFLRQVYLYL